MNSEVYQTYFEMTVAPSWAGSSSFHWHEILLAANWAMMRSAISVKRSVANARIVGPAPDRQMPKRPGWVAGVMDCRISVSPGIRVLRYGWWTLSCMARKIMSGSGGELPNAAGSRAARCRLKT